MTFAISTTETIEFAVANGGTVSMPYPSGFVQANFTGVNASADGAAVINANEVYLEAEGKVSFTYGASEIVVTNMSGAVWPAGSTIQCEYGQATATGQEDFISSEADFVEVGDPRYARRALSLSDLASAAAARENLGLGSAAEQDDTRYAHRANNLSDLASAAAARANLFGAAELPQSLGGTGAVALADALITLPEVGTVPLKTVVGAGTGSTAVITTFTADGTVGPFTLQAAASNAPGFTLVHVSGVRVPDGDYAVAGADLTFGAGKQPADGDPVEVVAYGGVPAEAALTVAPPYLAMSSRLLNDVLAGQPITPFHFGALEPDGARDAAPALRDALGFLLTENDVHMLDLAGRRWDIGSPVTYSDAPLTHKAVANGRLSALSSWTGGHMIDIRPPLPDEGANRLNNFALLNVSFNGGPAVGDPLVDGFLRTRNAMGVYVIGGEAQYCLGNGFWDETDRPAAEVVIAARRITGRGASSVGIRFTGSDCEVKDAIIRSCATGVYSSQSVSVIGTHIYDCSAAAIELAERIGTIVGNYIDNCPIVMHRMSSGNITGNKFLCTVTESMDGKGFLKWVVDAAQRDATGVTITGNHFLNASGGGTIDGFELGTAASTPNAVSQFYMLNNSFQAVTARSSHPKRRSANISAATTTTVDFSGFIPFGEIQNAQAHWLAASDSDAIPAIVARINATNVVTVRMSTAATGAAIVTGSINDDIF